MSLGLVLFGSEIKVAMKFTQDFEEFKEVLDKVRKKEGGRRKRKEGSHI